MSETLAMTLVERLEDVGCDREPFTDAHKHCICRLTNEAAREISRLQSRIEELETGLRKVVVAKMPGEARVIARSVLDAHKEGRE